MGIIRVQVPKAPPPPPKAIFIRPTGGRSHRERLMHFWSWTCEACLAGQHRMFNEEEAVRAAMQHKLAKHPEAFEKDSDYLRLNVRRPTVSTWTTR